MPYLIDGHNLIPKVPGLSLEVIDDEMQLIEMLVQFCRLRRKQVEVYFDKAPIDFPRSKKFGAVTARFVRQGHTADEAIRTRLQNLGRQARNWTVVSSDQAVQAAARSARAHFISAEAFAQQLVSAPHDTSDEPKARSEAMLSEEEVTKWLDLFKDKKDG